MKVRDTSQGRMYAISSEIGCTAINGAMAVDIPVGGQSVILALDKKIVIDGDDTAKFVEVRWGTNTAVGSRPVPAWLSDVLSGLISIVGDDNFDINYVPAENKLYLVFSLDTTVSQVAEVKSLLDRVLPSNVTTEMEWADGLPTSYTRLEYLETTKIGAWINTGLLFATGYIKVRTSNPVDSNPYDADRYTSPGHFVTGIIHPEYTGVDKQKNFMAYQETSAIFTIDISGIRNKYFDNRVPGVATVIIDTENGYAEVNGVRRSCTPFVLEETVAALPIFARQSWYSLTDCRYHVSSPYTRVHSFEVTAKANGNVQYGNFIPSINPSGVPGMFDSVTKTFKKSASTVPLTAGLTLQQVRDLNLPVPGPGDVNTLSISIPYEVYTDPEAWSVIQGEEEKGWTFTFYWADLVDYFTPKINAIVGAGNYTTTYNLAAQKLSLAFAFSVTEEQIEAVKNLLDRVLPSNIVTEMYWEDGFPVNYTRLEYLESSGSQWMITDFVPNNESGVMVRYINNSGNSTHPVVTREDVDGVKRGFSVATIRNVSSTTCVWGYQRDPANHIASTTAIVEGQTNYLNSRTVIWYNRETNYYLKRYIKTGAEYPDYPSPLSYTPTVPFHFCKDLWYGGNTNFRGKLLEAKFSRGEKDACIFVPALDDTGVPCMYDLLARKACYNSGSGHFIAGVETMEQLDAVLRGLPDYTGQTGGELHLRLSDELYEAAVVSGIIEETATAKNWQIAYDPTTITEAA